MTDVLMTDVLMTDVGGGMQIRRKLRSLEGLLQFRGNEQAISHTAHKLSIGAFALQTALDKVCLPILAGCSFGAGRGGRVELEGPEGWWGGSWVPYRGQGGTWMGVRGAFDWVHLAEM